MKKVTISDFDNRNINEDNSQAYQYLCDILNNIIEDAEKVFVDFAFEINNRKDGKIVLVIQSNRQRFRNICTITMYKSRIWFSIFNSLDIRINIENFSIADRDIERLKQGIIEKYSEITYNKEQISIYVPKNILEEVDKKMENGKSRNEFIVNAIKSSLERNFEPYGLFVNKAHQMSFEQLINDMDITNSDSEQARNIAFVYIIAYYNKWLYKSYRAKFEYDKSEQRIAIAEEVLNYIMNDSPVFRLAYHIKTGNTFDICKDYANDLGSDDSFECESFLTMTMMKIVKGYLSIKEGKLSEPKTAKIDMAKIFI